MQGKLWMEAATKFKIDEEFGNDDVDPDGDDEFLAAFDLALWQTLSGRTKLGARTTVNTIEWGRGLKAWHALSHDGAPHSNTDKQASRRRVMQPTACKDERALANVLPTWIGQVAEHERKFGAIDEDAKLDALITLMPQAMLS